MFALRVFQLLTVLVCYVALLSVLELAILCPFPSSCIYRSLASGIGQGLAFGVTCCTTSFVDFSGTNRDGAGVGSFSSLLV